MFDAIKKQTHARLMHRMAAHTGTDLGALPEGVRADAAERCCNCTSVGTCEDWLDDHPEGVRAAPSFCSNKALMDGAE